MKELGKKTIEVQWGTKPCPKSTSAGILIMKLRDAIEYEIRAWDKHEVNLGSPRVIDFDCYPNQADVVPAESRFSVYRKLVRLMNQVQEAGDSRLADRVGAHLAYLRELMGERLPLNTYYGLPLKVTSSFCYI